MNSPFEVVLMKRPVGVTILTVLMIFAGFSFVAGGLNFFLMGTRGAIAGGAVGGMAAVLSGLGAAAGVIFLLFGVLHVVLAIGLHQMRDAARILTVMLFALSLVGACIGAIVTLTRLAMLALGWDLLVLAVDIAVIWYLTRAHTKGAFEGDQAI
jgi:hypothetical protein